MTDPILNQLKNKTCPLPPGSVVVAYPRDSGGEEQERSVDQQLQFYVAYCQHFKLILLPSEQFADRARKGSSVVGRKGFDTLIEFLRAQAAPPEQRKKSDKNKERTVHGLLIWKHNRFGREPNDAQFFKSDLRRRGYTIISIVDNIPDGELGQIFEGLLDWKSKQDLVDISSDAKRGLAALVTTKKADGSYEGFAPGTPPKCLKRERVQTGLKRNGDPRLVSRWVPDPATWKRGQIAWQMRAAGASLKAIQKKTQLFKAENSFTTFFRNEIYRGVFNFGGMVLENFVPALCTEDEWNAVQKLRKAQTPDRHPRAIASTYLLTSKVYCAHCGSRMNGANGSKGWRYYMCAAKAKDTSACDSKRISATMVEQNIIDFLCDKVLSEAALTALYGNWYHTIVNAGQKFTARADEIKLKVKELERSVANLLDLVEQGQGGAAAGERLAQRQTELASHRELLVDIERQKAAILKLPPPTPELIQRFRAATIAKLKSGDPEQVKAVLQGFIIRIDAQSESGTVYYTVPLSLSSINCCTEGAPTEEAFVQQINMTWLQASVTRTSFFTRNAEIIAQRQGGAELHELAERYKLSIARVDQICEFRVPRRFPGRRSGKRR